jgi:predicted nucleic acid-binding protein
MSKLVFADTYYYLALINERDDGHERAVEFARSFKGRIVTTEWILAEVADALAAPHRRERLLGLYELLVDDLNVTIVGASHESFEGGMALYSKRTDKQWSLTDCISFTEMHDRGIKEALTADKHFAQAGFTPLLA